MITKYIYIYIYTDTQGNLTKSIDNIYLNINDQLSDCLPLTLTSSCLIQCPLSKTLMQYMYKTCHFIMIKTAFYLTCCKMHSYYIALSWWFNRPL